MMDDDWDELDALLIQALGQRPTAPFAETAGAILKREMMARGLGDCDPARLDPEFAGRILIAAWIEAAATCFPDQNPVALVGRLAALVDSISGSMGEDPVLHRVH